MRPERITLRPFASLPCQKGALFLNFKKTGEFLTQCITEKAFPSAQACVGNCEKNLFNWEYIQSSTEEHSQVKGAVSPVFDLASLTKLLSTAMCALRLIDLKELSLDKKLSYFFDQVPSDKADISLEQLLTHTGGFEPHWLLEKSCHSPSDIEENILTRPLKSRPGEEVLYSCMGYILLGKILEKVSKLSLDQLSDKLVFSPLGMTHTGYLPLIPGESGRKTLPTEWNGTHHISGMVHDENARFMGGISGNAGLFSSIEDVSIFARMLLRGGEGFLAKHTYDLFKRNLTPEKQSFRGLGVEIKKEGKLWPAGPLLSKGSFGHTGFTGTSLYVDPKRDLFFVLLTNRVYYGRDLSQIPRYRAQFHQHILKDLSII